MTSPNPQVAGRPTTQLATPPGRRKAHIPSSIRTRIITAVIGLSGLALLLAGLVVARVGAANLESHVVEEQVADAEALAALANTGNPATGVGFESPEALAKWALQRAVLTPAESAFVLKGGRVEWTAQPGVTLRAENDLSLVEKVAALENAPDVTVGSVTTDSHVWRYVVIPVRSAETEATAAFVRATDMRLASASLRQLNTTYGLVAAASLAVVGLAVWLLVGKLLAPVAMVRRTAQRITAQDLTERVAVTGTDELSQLSATINTMLDRLEAAVDGQRQLLDDVGHELRTPITIVRGHLEVMDLDDPNDVAASRALALTELTRMAGLVEDVVALAKSRRTEFFHLEIVDMADLTNEVFTKSRQLGRHEWQLAATAAVKARLDPERVAQAWLQLAANAARFAPTGSTVELGSAVSAGHLLLWVRDQGPGIPKELHQRLFERSYKGPDSQGSGLGLAIVAAIATGLGGQVTVDSEPGNGATFTLHLPLGGD